MPATGDIFVHDTFTAPDGTLLTDHVGEVGATWSGVNGGPSTLYISENRARGNVFANAAAIASGTSDGSEYDIEADVYLDGGGTAGGAFRLLARANTENQECYHFYQHATNGLTIIQRSSTTGALTALASVTLPSAVVGEHRIIKGEIRDAAKKMYIDGVEVLSVTDNSVSGNRVGIRFQPQWHYQADSITATNVATPINVTVPTSATIAGTSAVTVQPGLATRTQAAATGTSALTIEPAVRAAMAASIAGTSTVSIVASTSIGTVTVPLTVAIAGTSTITAHAGIQARANVSLAGNSVLAVVPGVRSGTSVAIVGTAELAAQVMLAISVAAEFAGTSSLTVSPAVMASTAATIDGSSVVLIIVGVTTGELVPHVILSAERIRILPLMIERNRQIPIAALRDALSMPVQATHERQMHTLAIARTIEPSPLATARTAEPSPLATARGKQGSGIAVARNKKE